MPRKQDFVWAFDIEFLIVAIREHALIPSSLSKNGLFKQNKPNLCPPCVSIIMTVQPHVSILCEVRSKVLYHYQRSTGYVCLLGA